NLRCSRPRRRAVRPDEARRLVHGRALIARINFRDATSAPPAPSECRAAAVPAGRVREVERSDPGDQSEGWRPCGAGRAVRTARTPGGAARPPTPLRPGACGARGPTRA